MSNFVQKITAIPSVIKGMLWGGPNQHPAQSKEDTFYPENTEANWIIVTWRLLSGFHSVGRKSLPYIVEYGYSLNPIGFGIINNIINSHYNISFTPYWKGKPYKSKTFSLDTEKALFNLVTTGTAVFWNREVVGFGRQIEVIDTLNIYETYNRGVYSYVYVKNDFRIKIPNEDLHFVIFRDTPEIKTQLGLSPLQAAIMPIEALKEMYTADTFLLKNKGSDILVSNNTDERISDTEEGTFDEVMNKRIAGAKNSGKIATTTANVQVHQLGRTIKELALWDGYKVKIRDFCVALGYPSTLAGDTEASTLANYEQSVTKLYTDCVIPLCRKLFASQKLQDWLGYEVYLDVSNISALQTSMTQKAEMAKTKQDAIVVLNTNVKNGTLTRDIAVNILVTEWEFDQEEAQKMIVQENNTGL